MKGDFMSKKFAKPLSFEEIAALPDSDIDTSDIPNLDLAFWAKATVAPPRTKPNVSLRIDEDVIAHFKRESPKGYTARMAAVLKAYVNAHRA
jgi:uncharacterized protein (DUF4415 family)